MCIKTVFAIHMGQIICCLLCIERHARELRCQTYISSLPYHMLQAVDRDERGKPNSNVSYSILSSVPQGLLSNFTMNNQYTGVIDVVWPVDFESLTSSVITLTVKATDGGTPGKSSTSSVEITVEDVNDHRPVFSPASDATVVLENATVGMTYIWHPQ